MAEQYACNAKIPTLITLIYKPEHWSTPWLMKRNLQIATACDSMLALPGPNSRGTLATVEMTNLLGKKISVIEIWTTN